VRLIIAPLLAIALASQPVAAQPKAQNTTIAQTPEHLALADELMKVSGTAELQMSMVPQVVDAVMPLVVRGNEAHADQIRTVVSEEMTIAFTAMLPELLLATRDAYATFLTDQELLDLTAFYRTPSGQQIIKMMPKISSQSITAGQDVGRNAAQRALPVIIERLQRANFKVPGRI
jgi:hypothetical protein